MKYSYNWLKELSGSKLSPIKMADLLTMHSLEVEQLSEIESTLDGIVVGNIINIKKHPNADRLQIVEVDTGGKKLKIVCGAWNIKIGDKVPVALVGATLPNGVKIKKSKIRGKKSFGMLCAEDELGFGTNHEGILILDEDCAIGKEVQKKDSTLKDTILEIKVLPDRAHDVMSHVGLAREMAILEKKKFDYDFDGLKLKTKKSKILTVEIEDEKLCPRYIGAVMEKVKIKESPLWMQNYLLAVGMKPINNVVDATNYVMLELGQPLHAFDREKINILSSEGEKITKIKVRRAQDKEKLILLDGKEIVLSPDDLLITNGNKPLALAGIMGGQNSGITEKTETIVLEAANFQATNIRRSRSRLKIKTEASDRFEKNIDPNLCEKAMVRVIEILEHIAEAKLEGVVDIYPKPVKEKKIKLDLIYVNKLLGEKIPTAKTLKLLNDLGIRTKKVKKDLIECLIPTIRIDLITQENLIEEIGRLWGYDNILPTPLIEPVIPARQNDLLLFEQTVRRRMADLGFDELYNYSFYSRQDAKFCGLAEEKHYSIANPMNPDQALVRISLIPNILKRLRENLKYFTQIKIFEIGRNYFFQENKIQEERILAGALILEKDSTAETFYNLKGKLDDFLETIGLKGELAPMLDEEISSVMHHTRVAKIKLGKEKKKVGSIFEVTPLVLKKYKINKRVAVFEIDLKKLSPLTKVIKKYQPLQKYPTILRDVSLLSGANNSVAEIIDFIKETGGSLILDVKMFDVFKKEDKTSLAFHIEFGAKERTLEKEEVDVVMQKIMEQLEKKLAVEVRK